MNNVPAEVGIESIARFQALQAGQYWRAKQGIDQAISEGMVLLIQSIRWVDEAPHTIILRPHPSKIKHYGEHRFLLADFLAQFDFEPDSQQIRSNELRTIQSRINDLQTELVETQSNPALLAAVVESGLQEQVQTNQKQDGVTKEQPQENSLPMLANQADPATVSLVTGSVANAIGSGITHEGITAMKAAAKREHQIATVKAKWIQGKTSEIAKTIQEMAPFYEEQAAAVLAQTEDSRSYVAKLLEGIESLYLYVGQDVAVVTLREGAAAEQDVPLTFVQRKLLMDEELAVWTDVDEWFDFSKEQCFFDALKQHDGLVEQIFPTERCVLVMATTRRFIDYGDKWENAVRNTENSKVFMLVRNGMNIYQVISPVESHLGTARLFPTKDDQDRVFRGFDGQQIKFEDVAYTDKLARHDSFALHYKRFLLLCCGLDHRLKLFGDFYDCPESLRFVSLEFQEQYCRFLHDDDHSSLLADTSHAPVGKWISSKNAYLRSGSRVQCIWGLAMTPKTAPGACKYDGGSYGSFSCRYNPADSMGVEIAYKDGDSICVDIAVSGYSYSRHDDRTFTCKVNLSKYIAERNDSGLAFLCLDAVTPEDLRWYIHNRGSRENHLTYIRFFKLALKFIERERLEESGTRERLMQAMADGNIADLSEREEIINQSVIAWRASNRGKPLPRVDVGIPSRAWKSLLDQMYMLAGEGKRRVEEIEAYIHEIGLEPLRLVMSGNANLVVYAAPMPSECDNRLEPHAWVHRLTIERGKTKYIEKSRKWVLLPKRAASETTLHQWAGAEEWSARTTGFPSFERKIELMAEAGRFQSRLTMLSSGMNDCDFELQVSAWEFARDDATDNSKYVRNPMIAVPFGLIYYPRGNVLRFLCAGVYDAHALLASGAPDKAAVSRLRSSFIRPYQHKDKAMLLFNKEIDAGASWRLYETTLSHADSRYGMYVSRDLGVNFNLLERQSDSPLLADWLNNWKTDNQKEKLWLADGALDDEGNLALDRMLGIKLPDDYELLEATTIQVRRTGTGVMPAFCEWLDIIQKDKAALPGSPFCSNKLITLAKGIVPEAEQHNLHLTGSTSVFTSRLEARESAIKRAKSLGTTWKAVLYSDLPDAPNPPEGVERWYFVDSRVPQTEAEQ